MKKTLLNLFFISILSFSVFSQNRYGVANVNTTFDGVTGVTIEFWDAAVIDEGLAANGFEDVPVIDESANNGDGILTVQTIVHDPANTQWWTYSGNIQYINWDAEGNATPFALGSNGRATIIVEVPDTVGIWLKLDSLTWRSGFPAIEVGDTITELNKPVAITVDFVALASKFPGADINSQDYSAFYAWFWAVDGTKQPVKIYNIKIGDLNNVSVEEVAQDGAFAEVLASGDIASIEVTNILGQAVEVVESVDQISAQGVLVLKVTKNDGSEVIGKIVK